MVVFVISEDELGENTAPEGEWSRDGIDAVCVKLFRQVKRVFALSPCFKTDSPDLVKITDHPR